MANFKTVTEYGTVTISRGNSKIGNIPNISLPPIKSCKNCSLCKKDCYALKSYRQYKEVKKCWNDNFKAYGGNENAYFKAIETTLSKIKDLNYFRWHISGDIQNQLYLDSMSYIAEQFPNTRFLAFTKMYDLDYSRIPDNLAIIISLWPGITEKDIPEKNQCMPMAYMYDGTNENEIPLKAVPCSGNCETCGQCFFVQETGIDVVFHKH